jgi:hypothetical protein
MLRLKYLILSRLTIVLDDEATNQLARIIFIANVYTIFVDLAK